MDISHVVLPESRWVQMGNLNFHYLDWGGPDRRPVIFLHGGGLTAHTFDLVCLALSGTYHCIALDQRGHGDSDWSDLGQYGIDTNCNDLAEFVGRLSLTMPALVGMSMGGLSALAYAGGMSRNLAALVVIDVGPETSQGGGSRIRKFLLDSEPADLNEHVERALRFNPRRNRRLLIRSLLNNLRQVEDGRWIWKWDPRAVQPTDQAGAAARRRQLWSEAPLIRCPTLIVRGAESDVFLREHAERLAQAIPKARQVEIAGAGHTVQGDNPVALTRAMREFFAAVWPPE
jgi:pimeloyl-ACP methyl ester carboxylesterase